MNPPTQAIKLLTLRTAFEHLNAHVTKDSTAARLDIVSMFYPYVAPSDVYHPDVLPHLAHVKNTVSNELADMLFEFYCACQLIASLNGLPVERSFQVDKDVRQTSLETIKRLYPVIVSAFDKHASVA